MIYLTPSSHRLQITAPFCIYTFMQEQYWELYVQKSCRFSAAPVLLSHTKQAPCASLLSGCAVSRPSSHLHRLHQSCY